MKEEVKKEKERALEEIDKLIIIKYSIDDLLEIVERWGDEAAKSSTIKFKAMLELSRLLLKLKEEIEAKELELLERVFTQ